MAVFAEHVREMNERVIELSRSYAIFWVFIGSYKRYSKVIEDHRDFFDAIASSLLQGFCVITYQLFDKRADVKSLPRILDYLTSLDSALEQRLRLKIDAQALLLQRFFAYRHKIFAHRDRAKSPWEVFGSVPKTRLKREMKTIVRLSRETICILGGASGVKKKAKMIQAIRLRENHARWDAKEILKALEKNCV